MTTAYEYVTTPKPVTDWIRGRLLRQASDDAGAEIEGAQPRWTIEDTRRVAEFTVYLPGFNDARDECGRGYTLSADLFFARRQRVALGAIRYNSLGFPRYDHLGSIRKHWAAYQQDGNQEHLADAINLLALEWLHPSREGGSYQAPRIVDQFLLTTHLDCYLEYGWREELPQAANALEREWLNPTVQNSHFHAVDEGGHHTEELA